ncbi:hypothetical protein BC936DRAFT_146111 [Jimgerdemannia flammicorona]|uniref:Uncharacterized protein n=2 Tax=Jimgerdemannia flammicorona TaxID=994334 RepID=A0A433QAK2_9FUNG|nr:hypothetical protein BC936DRAFT_146111 [Jimgerdemannia flammicorona]RUS26754.1 hypothetical protein BC938DRAFT_484169 [Jimgerdemannia flammicorona]
MHDESMPILPSFVPNSLHPITKHTTSETDHQNRRQPTIDYIRVTGRRDEEQTTVDPRILDVAIAHSGELFAEVSRVLVLDILDNGLPAA